MQRVLLAVEAQQLRDHGTLCGCGHSRGAHVVPQLGDGAQPLLTGRLTEHQCSRADDAGDREVQYPPAAAGDRDRIDEAVTLSDELLEVAERLSIPLPAD